MMPKWEYARLEYYSSDERANTLLLFFRTNESKRDVNMNSTIAELGLDGWELVTFTDVVKPTIYNKPCNVVTYLFKRKVL